MPRLSYGADHIYGEAAFEVLAKAQEMEREGKKVLHFEIGEPDMETPAYISNAGIASILDKKTHYTPSIGITELREAVVDEVEKTRGFRPSIDQVAITPGLKPGIFFSMLAIINPGDEIILPDPGYPTYGSVVSMVGAKPVPVSLSEKNSFRMNPSDVEACITKKTKLIIINSPHNPTGSVMTEHELSEIYDLARRNDLFIISDEVYSKMIYPGILHKSITENDRALERTVLLDGWSKCYAMTGWRLGYVVGPVSLIDRLRDFLVSAVSCTAAFTQWAGVAALKGDQSFIREMMDRFEQKRRHITEGLNRIKGFSCQIPYGAFYAFPSIQGTGMSSKDCSEFILEKAGIATVPGTAFGEAGEGYLRFSYATSIEIIDEAMERLRKLF